MLVTIPRPRLFPKIRLASLYALRERCSTSFLMPSSDPACSKHERLIIVRITGGIGWAMLASEVQTRPGNIALCSSVERKSFLSTITRRSDHFSRTRERVGYRLGLKTELRYDATIITTYFQPYIVGKMPLEKFLEVSTFSMYIF